ncbi:AzlD domain-containing protein [Peribacillus simplex]|uniref:AzlD domain-containing protein n=1 Tax=Peribacillus simplex TaxID=1478 RepID=UPI000970984B|nr:AzlD domain-containing protein [Peribacillus simplex]
MFQVVVIYWRGGVKTNSSYLFLLIGMTIITYLCRRLLLRVPDRILTKRLKSGLAFVPIGIYSGLVFPSLFIGETGLQWKPLYLFASIFCLLTLRFTNNFLLSFFIGMGFVLIGSSF